MFAQPTKKHMKCLVSAALKGIYKTSILPCMRTSLPLLLAIAGCSAAWIESADALDKKDCKGVVLDDGPFAERVVRDKRDNSHGALSNSEMRPLGGGEGYGKIVPRPTTEGTIFQPRATVVQGTFVPLPATIVRTADELRAALLVAARAPQTIYVNDAAEIDLSYCAKTPAPRKRRREPRSRPDACSDFSLVIPANTTLASGRGRHGSRGARLFSRTFTDCPLFEVKGAGVRISGLRIHGPDSSVENDDPIHCQRWRGDRDQRHHG